MDSKTNVNSVIRATQILELLDASRRGMNISEIGRRLNIPKSSAHVLVVTLEGLGYLNKVENLYQLSLKVYDLGREHMGNLELPGVSLAYMKFLSAETRLTCHLAVLERFQGVIVQRVEGRGPVRFDTFLGKRIPLHCTALGKVLLTYAGDSVRRQVLLKGTFMRHTRKTIASANELQKALMVVRELGYAIDDEEEELSVRCVSVPVVDCASECVAALSLCGTVEEIDERTMPQLIRTLRQTAQRIGAALTRRHADAS